MELPSRGVLLRLAIKGSLGFPWLSFLCDVEKKFAIIDKNDC